MNQTRILKIAIATITALVSLYVHAQSITTTIFDNSGNIPYRIPSICTTPKGRLIAFADYRTSKQDIGRGRVDLRVRWSDDNGITWSDVQTPEVMTGDGTLLQGYQKGAYGDPCSVADCKTGKIMLTSCSGSPNFFEGNREHHQGWARWYSEDGGKTWSAPVYLDEEFIYSKFDKSKYGPIKGWFVGSGKIHQSRYTKVGRYYRLYCAGSSQNANSTASTANWVLYSDDFGESWEFLGGCDESPVPGGDEPKVEELPNGNILISSRTTRGRYFNIYQFTDMAKGIGTWGEKALSSQSVNGLIANNGCNGEIQIVPVVRLKDNVRTWIALQSLPVSGRTNVSIFYKDLEDRNTYANPANFAKDWIKGIQVSNTTSAYSTWSMCRDHTVAFLYEENESNGGYDIIYKNLSIEDITNQAYRYDTKAKLHSLKKRK